MNNRVQRLTQPAGHIFVLSLVLLFAGLSSSVATAASLNAGVAKVDITNYDAGPVHDPMYVKALVLNTGEATLVIITVDAVAIGEIGHIKNDYLPAVRARLEKELGIKPENVLVNASHCHGRILGNIVEHTVKAVSVAVQKSVPVLIATGLGHEDRVMENRRFILKNGDQVDSRRAYPLPPDETFASVGPIDPEIGVLRIDKENGETLAVVYNFAMHPIQGVASGENTADITGIASQVIEDNLDEGTMALFIQGCAGDINPAYYKDIEHPHDAVPWGNFLGLSTLRAVRSIKPKDDGRLVILHETLELPRANFEERIKKTEEQRENLLNSLSGVSINFKTFYSMMVKYNTFEKYPSQYAHRYMHEEMIESKDLNVHDSINRGLMKQYLNNIHTMEALVRLQTNLRLLKVHQQDYIEAKGEPIQVEVMAVRIGDFVAVTFPGELTVQIGLNIKASSPHENTFVAGYTNGYIYYAPTAEQARNTGHGQEDSDTILAPEWQAIYEAKVTEMLTKL